MSVIWGKHLRFIRTSKTDYSQSDVARILHIDRSTYSYYELGKSEPSLDVLKQMAKLFEVSLDKLLGYEDNEYIH